MTSRTFILHDARYLDRCIAFLRDEGPSRFPSGKLRRVPYRVIIEPDYAQRTSQQNRALHKYCQLLADALNAAGFEMQVVITGTTFCMSVLWTGISVKENIWRPVQIAMLGVESTTELTTVDPTGIHEAVMKRVCECTGIEWIDWPSEDSGPDLVPRKRRAA